MSKGYPSMTALLGLLAIAGYQNRDKLAELLKGRDSEHGSTSHPTAPAPSSQTSKSGSDSALSSILGGVGTAGIGGLIASGLSELVDHFTKGGHAETAKSWIDQGPNRDLSEIDLERAIGPETIDQLAQQTGLSRADVLSRLTRELPSAIDRYSPDGRLPA